MPLGGKRTEKVTAETQRTVLDIVHEQPDFTLVAINRELGARLPGALHVSTSTISNILQGQLITMKKLEDAPAERTSLMQRKSNVLSTVSGSWGTFNASI